MSTPARWWCWRLGVWVFSMIVMVANWAVWSGVFQDRLPGWLWFPACLAFMLGVSFLAASAITDGRPLLRGLRGRRGPAAHADSPPR